MQVHGAPDALVWFWHRECHGLLVQVSDVDFFESATHVHYYHSKSVLIFSSVQDRCLRSQHRAERNLTMAFLREGRSHTPFDERSARRFCPKADRTSHLMSTQGGGLVMRSQRGRLPRLRVTWNLPHSHAIVGQQSERVIWIMAFRLRDSCVSATATRDTRTKQSSCTCRSFVPVSRRVRVRCSRGSTPQRSLTLVSLPFHSSRFPDVRDKGGHSNAWSASHPLLAVLVVHT